MKAMPHNLEAESAFLSCVLLDESTLDAYPLSPGDFYRQSNRVIYESMLELRRSKTPIDLITLCDKMTGEKLEKAGGVSAVTALGSVSPSAKLAGKYAAIIEEKAKRRAAIRAAEELADEAENGESIEEALEQSQKALTSLLIRGQAEEPGPVESMLSFMKWIEERAEGKEAGILSGLSDLDRMTHGFMPGQLAILAARPSMGKTALALNIAAHNLKRGVPVAIFSLETPRENLLARFAAMFEGMTLEKVLNPTAEEMGNLVEIADAMSKWQFTISDNTFTLSAIVQKIRRAAAAGVKLAIIDYLQLIQAERRENRTQEVSLISRTLKETALDCRLPVLALSQLSRGVESRTDKRPLLSDLRESGGIEQDADLVMMLYRDTYYDAAGDAWTECNLAKNRDGGTGRVKLAFVPEKMRFTGWIGPEAFGSITEAQPI